MAQDSAGGEVRTVAIERLGNKVILELTCADEYAAMLLKDRVTASLREGYARLDLWTGREW